MIIKSNIYFLLLSKNISKREGKRGIEAVREEQQEGERFAGARCCILRHSAGVVHERKLQAGIALAA